MTMQEGKKENASKGSGLTRRKFLLTGGLALGSATAMLYFARGPLRRAAAQYVSEMDLMSGIFNFEPDFWLEVQEDNTVLLKSPKVEMGQDIFTGFAILVAEELDVPLASIVVAPGSAHKSAMDYAGTGGSSTTASLYVPLRKLAATFREMLKLAAAKQWGVDVETVETEDGVLLSGSHRVSYAEIVASTTEWEKIEAPELRPSSSFRHVGKEVRRTDLLPKVLGEPIYGMDAELPGMHHATVLYSPFIGGTLESLDTAVAEAFPGVQQVIQEKDLVAVVADSRYAAEMGKRQLQAKWNVPRVWQQEDIEELVTVGNGSPVSIQVSGDVRPHLDGEDEKVFEAEYRTPLGAHAHLEPNGAVADVGPDRALIITGTQMVATVQGEVAKTLGLGKDQVEVQNCFLGGGFGRRYFRNNASDAARVSQALGKPVHVFKDREDEFRNGYLRPNTHHVFRGRLNDGGSLVALEHLLATGDMMLDHGPLGALDWALGGDWISAGHGLRIIYDVPNKNADMWHKRLPFQTGIWRGVGMYTNTFATESFMDELAVGAGIDPLEFRLAHLTSEEPILQRMHQALVAVAEASGWARPRTGDVGWGIACAEDRKTVAATVVEVTVEEGKIRVQKVTQAIDPGLIIHPEGVRTQVEGSTMMGISAALYEDVQIRDGQIHPTNYHQYPMASLKDTPEVEVLLLQGSSKPSGVGEPPIAPIAPAIANAVFNLTGQRLRSLPLKLG